MDKEETEICYTVKLPHSSLYQLWTALKPWEGKFYANGEEYPQSILREEIADIIGMGEEWRR